MSGVQVIKPPYPTFYGQTAIYSSIVDAIPPGFLSTEDRIMRYIAETYGEKNVELMEIIHVSEEERLLGTHPYWRVVTERGLVREWRYWYAQYSLRERVRRLETEGHVIIPSSSGVSLQVQEHKEKMVDLYALDIILPPKHLAGRRVSR